MPTLRFLGNAKLVAACAALLTLLTAAAAHLNAARELDVRENLRTTARRTELLAHHHFEAGEIENSARELASEHYHAEIFAALYGKSGVASELSQLKPTAFGASLFVLLWVPFFAWFVAHREARQTRSLRSLALCVAAWTAGTTVLALALSALTSGLSGVWDAGAARFVWPALLQAAIYGLVFACLYGLVRRRSLAFLGAGLALIMVGALNVLWLENTAAAWAWLLPRRWELLALSRSGTDLAISSLPLAGYLLPALRK